MQILVRKVRNKAAGQQGLVLLCIASLRCDLPSATLTLHFDDTVFIYLCLMYR